VPAGSEIEISIEIDASRTVRAEAYVRCWTPTSRSPWPWVAPRRRPPPSCAPAFPRSPTGRTRYAGRWPNSRCPRPPAPWTGSTPRACWRGRSTAARRRGGPGGRVHLSRRLLDAETLLDDVETPSSCPALMERVRQPARGGGPASRHRGHRGRPVRPGGPRTPPPRRPWPIGTARCCADRPTCCWRIGARVLRRTGKLEVLVFEDLRRTLAKSKNEEVRRLDSLAVARRSRHKDPGELATVNTLLRKKLPKGREASTASWFFHGRRR